MSRIEPLRHYCGATARLLLIGGVACATLALAALSFGAIAITVVALAS